MYCREKYHIRPNFPKNPRRNQNQRKFKKSQKRAYISWDNDDIESSDKEKANIFVMENYQNDEVTPHFIIKTYLTFVRN